MTLPNTNLRVGANSSLGLFVACVGHELAPVDLLDVLLEMVDGAERAVAKVANRVARMDDHVVAKRLYHIELLVADEALDLRIVLGLQPRPIWKQLGIGQCRLEGGVLSRLPFSRRLQQLFCRIFMIEGIPKRIEFL